MRSCAASAERGLAQRSCRTTPACVLYVFGVETYHGCLFRDGASRLVSVAHVGSVRISAVPSQLVAWGERLVNAIGVPVAGVGADLARRAAT